MSPAERPAQPIVGAAEQAAPDQMAAGTSGALRGDFGEVDTIPPALAQKDVDELAEKYEIPAQFEPRAARPGEVASRPPPGFVAIYRDQLMAGLRLPIPNFLFFILTFWGIRITQVIPNAVRSIIGFFILCRALEIPFSLDLFRAFFQMKVSGKVPGWFYFARRSGTKTPTREVFTGAPSSIKDWKPQFFFVKNLGFPPLTWRAETQVSDPIPSPLPVSELSRLLSSDTKLDVKEFSNGQLWAAGLIRASSSDPSLEDRPLSTDELDVLKRFSSLLSIGGSSNPGAATQTPSAIPASSVPAPVPQPAPAQSSKAVEAGKKKKKKTTAKRARVETPSSPAREERPTPEPAQSGHYGVNTVEEQARAEAPPNLWQRQSSLLFDPQTQLTTHQHPMHFCPQWKLSINDRAQFPDAARELIQGAILPRDFNLTRPNGAANEKLLSQNAAAVAEAEGLKKQLAQVHTNFELELKKNADLTSQLKGEQQKAAGLSAQAEAARAEGSQEGVRTFLRSEEFRGDLAILNTPVLQHGYSQALQEVQGLGLPGFDLGNFPSYNPLAVEQLDRLVEGYTHGRKLVDLVADPLLPVTTPESEQEEEEGEN
ncbi:uncharacterized protein LOC113780294 [Coffea eugenioides]|uniref:uncharacterized protein LOC113780294 n=1 Tax=Coffea eugenioides TaxID=49369 RepID=UPI000F60FC6A|nr:uncharacterized protein LOC113780294 [Coffea eugenioides]